MKLPREIRSMDIEDIHVGERQRALRADSVKALAASMNEIGLMTPISIRVVDGPIQIDGEEVWSVPCLIAGAHRLAAAKANGWSKIDCYVLGSEDADARMWEIAENLHRAELTVLERADHVAEWIRLSDDKLLQVATVSGGRGNRGGVRAASRELNIEITEAHRAGKIAGINPEAKEAAKAANLDDNQSALLRIAAADAESQVEKVRELSRRKEQRKQIAGAQDAINKHDGAEAAADILAAYIPEEDHDRLIAALATTSTKDLIRAFKRATADRVAA